MEEHSVARFEQVVLPHLDAAYNLARWLVRSREDAEDLVQGALLKAFQAVDGFRGADGRAWLLAIVRNACYDRLRGHRAHDTTTAFDEEIHTPDGSAQNPETLMIQDADGARVRAALETLPPEFREVLVLREIEGLSYKEIAAVVDISLGTVMSRLARARGRLQRALAAPRDEAPSGGGR